MIRRIFCILLIALGAGLDGYFYVFRFRADGLNLAVALSCAAGLELLLAFAVWNAQKSKIFTGLAIAITFFAVIQTSAGQTFSLLSRDAEAGNTTSTVSDLMREEKKTLERIDSEYSIITKQLASIRTVEDRAAYALTIGRMTTRLSELSKERNTSSSKLSALADKNGNSEIVRVKEMSVYDFYASMPGWKGMDWLKFIFHTFFSVLIAVMTPIGLLTWDVKSAGRILKKSSLTEREIAEWVKQCWYKIRIGTSKKILSEETFYENCARDGVVVSPGVYNECTRRALALGVINRDGTAIIDDMESIKKAMYKGV